MAHIYQVGLLLLLVKCLNAQGDEPRGFPQQIPFTGRGMPDRNYYLWMNSQHPNAFNHFHNYPAQFPSFPVQEVPYFFRNFPGNPQFHPMTPQIFHNQGKDSQEFPPGFDQRPVNPHGTFEIFPSKPKTTPPLPPTSTSTTTTTTTTEPPETEPQSETSPEDSPSTDAPEKESERSGVLFKSATNGFTNAHHYPFPIGLWSQYKKTAGFDKFETTNQENPSPVNPRKYPSLLLLPPNQFAFLQNQQHGFPGWNYGGHNFLSLGQGVVPPALLHMEENDDPIGDLENGRSNIGDSKYKIYAIPLQSLLNQMKTENEKSRV